ncbi:hypothetical protein [Pseudomonas sp. 2835]|uniref:hypothetical protein n=1 Tax=Pseudomonas sp. 2835 TaxID=3156451 RepID=UPI003D261A02
MKATGRSLCDFFERTAAEERLLDCVKQGKIAQLSPVRPNHSSIDNRVSADFLRFLLLGGDESAPVHERGVQLQGAYIEGKLDMNGTTLQQGINLSHCTFSESPDFTDTQVSGSINLRDSTSPGFIANRLTTRGMVDMTRFWCRGRMSVDDARFGGSLIMAGARLHGHGGRSLSADRVEIRGALSLYGGTVADGEVSLQGAQILGVVDCSGSCFYGSDGNAINLDHSQLGEELNLAKGFSAVGAVRVAGAQVEGALNCFDATLDGQGDTALWFDAACIKGNVYLNGGFKARGRISCKGAIIEGQLNCIGASLDGCGGVAFSADGAHVKQDVVFRRGFSAVGAVRLLGAKIAGQLICNGRFDGDGEEALHADGVVVGGGTFLGTDFSSNGPVRLMFAEIAGQLVISGGRFDGSGQEALVADGVMIKGDFHITGNTRFTGEVCLLGAQIDDQFGCKDVVFDGAGGDAVSADGGVIKGNVILSEGFQAYGTVRMVGAQIGGDLNCNTARLDGFGRVALDADRVLVDGSVSLQNGFRSEGGVRFRGAQIAGELNCSAAGLGGKSGTSPFLLDNMRLGGKLVLRALESPLSNASFTGADISVLDDDEGTWGNNIALNGFVYAAFSSGAVVNATFRASWLDKQVANMAAVNDQSNPANDFRPQPWRQLQKVLVEMGHSAEARDVGIAFERRLRDIGHVGQSPENWWPWAGRIYTATSRALHCLYGLLTGFGYRPMQLLIWFLAMWLICAGIYWYAALHKRVFAPSNPLVFQNEAYFDCRPDRGDAWRGANPGQEMPPTYYGEGNWYLCQTLREEYTGFSPLAYSLDVLMPLVDLQQESDWAPLVPTPKQGYWDEFTSFGWKHFIRLLIWFEILVGWGISLLMVAIVSGLARRSE